jgi:polyhydroxyalkanoate synthesis regulator phasin
MLLDDLRMLAEKTRGNLEEDEEQQLSKVLSDLTPVVEKLTQGEADAESEA